jgi:MFS family permease
MAPEAPTANRPRLPSTVVALGVVSLLNDAASEAIYPLLPAFLASLGGGPALLGVIEGVADATASLVKLASGWLADRAGRSKSLTVAGYVLANLVRPLTALAQLWWHLLAIRFCDRVGKGIRSPPRDALLAAAAPLALRGRAFGFHRAMDHTGALVGAGAAWLLLAAHLPLRQLFAWTALPGGLAVAVLIASVREAPQKARPAPLEMGLPPVPGYRRLLFALGLFALGNSSDAFLLWRARELGVPVAAAPIVWIALHLVKAGSSTWGGAMSDRLGRRLLIRVGWTVYALAYLGLGYARESWQVWVLVAFYGLHFGLSEGPEKALIVDLVPAEWRGRALGAYHAVMGLAALPASILFGLVYRAAGPTWAFASGAALALGAALLLPTAAAKSAP